MCCRLVSIVSGVAVLWREAYRIAGHIGLHTRAIYIIHSVSIASQRKMAQVSAKRKRCGVFKEEWTEEYYFVQHNGKPLCLICNKDLSERSFKVSNVSRHYLKEHVKNNHPACALTGQLRKNKILRLKQICKHSHQCLLKEMMKSREQCRLDMQFAN